MTAKVRNSIVLFGKLLAEPNVELRLHATVPYNSIYRADNQLLVNIRIYGVVATNAPVFHLRKIPGGEMASTYMESFERVWDGATPYEEPGSEPADRLLRRPGGAECQQPGAFGQCRGGQRCRDVLMIRRSDNDNWAVPGGAIDLGESMVQAAVRETREETGIECEITGLVGIYIDPKHVILYTSNGEARQEFSILLTGWRPGGGLRRAAIRAKCGG